MEVAKGAAREEAAKEAEAKVAEAKVAAVKAAAERAVVAMVGEREEVGMVVVAMAAEREVVELVVVVKVEAREGVAMGEAEREAEPRVAVVMAVAAMEVEQAVLAAERANAVLLHRAASCSHQPQLRAMTHVLVAVRATISPRSASSSPCRLAPSRVRLDGTSASRRLRSSAARRRR